MDDRSTALPTAAPRETAPDSRPRDRAAWVDNLRVVIIVGVIGAHVSLIYALDVGWYYEERTAGEVTKALLAGIFSPALVFGMGLLFFVAGLFTPGAFDRKGPRRFMTDRLWRLGIPVLAYLFIVNPGMDYFGDRAAGRREGVVDYFRRGYLDDVAFGIAWFMLALLVFSFGYAGWRRRHPAVRGAAVPLGRSDLVKAAGFVAAVAAASLWAVDWFRRRWSSSGPIGRAMGRASFSAYLVHAPLTVIFAIALRDVDLVAEAKLLTVFTASTIASYGLGWMFTRSDATGRVL